MTKDGRTAVYIGLGSNVDPEASIPRALERLAAAVSLTGLSDFYRTAPVGPPGQPAFVNGVALVRTGLPARRLKFEVLRKIEAELGRRRSAADSCLPRPIDLDILVYGNLVASEPDLVIPDPDIPQRAFLVAGLLELAPGLVLPGARTPLRAAVPAPGASLEPMPGFSRDLRERFVRKGGLRREP